jgi:hypothetical protein
MRMGQGMQQQARPRSRLQGLGRVDSRTRFGDRRRENEGGGGGGVGRRLALERRFTQQQQRLPFLPPAGRHSHFEV